VTSGSRRRISGAATRTASAWADSRSQSRDGERCGRGVVVFVVGWDGLEAVPHLELDLVIDKLRGCVEQLRVERVGAEAARDGEDLDLTRPT
jgi:hypothetical protein